MVLLLYTVSNIYVFFAISFSFPFRNSHATFFLAFFFRLMWLNVIIIYQAESTYLNEIICDATHFSLWNCITILKSEKKTTNTHTHRDIEKKSEKENNEKVQCQKLNVDLCEKFACNKSKSVLFQRFQVGWNKQTNKTKKKNEERESQTEHTEYRMPKQEECLVYSAFKKRNYSTHWNQENRQTHRETATYQHSHTHTKPVQQDCVYTFRRGKIGLGLAQTNENIKWIIFRHIKRHQIDAQKKYTHISVAFALILLALDLLSTQSVGVCFFFRRACGQKATGRYILSLHRDSCCCCCCCCCSPFFWLVLWLCNWKQ